MTETMERRTQRIKKVPAKLKDNALADEPLLSPDGKFIDSVVVLSPAYKARKHFCLPSVVYCSVGEPPEADCSFPEVGE